MGDDNDSLTGQDIDKLVGAVDKWESVKDTNPIGTTRLAEENVLLEKSANEALLPHQKSKDKFINNSLQVTPMPGGPKGSIDLENKLIGLGRDYTKGGYVRRYKADTYLHPEHNCHVPVIRAGKSGVVYLMKSCDERGIDELDNKQIAVKVLRKELEGNEEDKEKYAKEIEVAAQLEHECIVQTLEANVDKGFIVMECMDLRLDDALINQDFLEKLDVSIIVNYLCEMAGALEYARWKVRLEAHRDLHAGNIFFNKVGDEYVLKIGDFGKALFHRSTTDPNIESMTDYTAVTHEKGVEMDKMLFGERPVPIDAHNPDFPQDSLIDVYSLGFWGSKLLNLVDADETVHKLRSICADAITPRDKNNQYGRQGHFPEGIWDFIDKITEAAGKIYVHENPNYYWRPGTGNKGAERYLEELGFHSDAFLDLREEQVLEIGPKPKKDDVPLDLVNSLITEITRVRENISIKLKNHSGKSIEEEELAEKVVFRDLDRVIRAFHIKLDGLGDIIGESCAEVGRIPTSTYRKNFGGVSYFSELISDRINMTRNMFVTLDKLEGLVNDWPEQPIAYDIKCDTKALRTNLNVCEKYLQLDLQLFRNKESYQTPWSKTLDHLKKITRYSWFKPFCFFVVGSVGISGYFTSGLYDDSRMSLLYGNQEEVMESTETLVITEDFDAGSHHGSSDSSYAGRDIEDVFLDVSHEDAFVVQADVGDSGLSVEAGRDTLQNESQVSLVEAGMDNSREEVYRQTCDLVGRGRRRRVLTLDSCTRANYPSDVYIAALYINNRGLPTKALTATHPESAIKALPDVEGAGVYQVKILKTACNVSHGHKNQWVPIHAFGSGIRCMRRRYSHYNGLLDEFMITQ